MNDYLNRILPMVGGVLMSKKYMFVNLENTHRIAEGFARCGARNMFFFDKSQYERGSNLYESYGKTPEFDFRASRVLESVLRKHNHYVTDWNFTEIDFDDFLDSHIKRYDPDIIIGGGNIEECGYLADMSRIHKKPAVIFTNLLYSHVHSVISVMDPANGVDWSIFDGLTNSTVAGVGDRIDWLENSALAGLLAKAMLLRDSRYQDKFLEKLIYTDKRNTILRGTDEWPWWVLYGSKKSKKRMHDLMSTSQQRSRRNYCPAENEKLMVIGCGTSSLMIEEALNYYKSVCLIDYKPFSVYNPVRQWVTTKDAESGDPKPYVMQSIIARRFGNKASKLGAYHKMEIGDRSVWAANMRISDSVNGSVDDFMDLLEIFKPTVVVVGMGQAKDDNFTVSDILRKRDIKHIVPGIFPLATHYKHIVVDGKMGPCYGCFQKRLIIDTEGSVELTKEQYEMFYGFGKYEEGTQPATIFETWPSCHVLLRLTVQLSLSPEKRSKWFKDCLQKNSACWVGANTIKHQEEEGVLYGTTFPGQVVTYSEKDIVGMSKNMECPLCGRLVEIDDSHVIPEEAPTPFFKPF